MQNQQLLTLTEMQQVYLEMLIEFDALCRKYNLRYDLCGGSMLGAVRHKGFIPWDDDIDVSLPRPDYRRLLGLYLKGKLELPGHRDLIMFNNKTFARHYARYIRYDVKRTPDMAEEDDCPYIGLDIFAVDGLPSREPALSREIFTIRQLRRCLLTSVEKAGTSRKGKLAAAVKDIYRPALKKFGSYRLAAMLDRECRRVDYETAEYVGIANGMYGKKERWLKKDMLPQKMYEFEGHLFPGYENADIYLTNLYGDYMKMPPKEAQQPHGDRGYRVPVEDGAESE
ncbi:MAG: LicD family protein [Lachnospiraceae bacterium]|nr:LicD family protein [Lachnospiraceae bacterium]